MRLIERSMLRSGDDLRRINDEYEYQIAYARAVRRAAEIREAVLKTSDATEADARAYAIRLMGRDVDDRFAACDATADGFSDVLARLMDERAITAEAAAEAIEWVFGASTEAAR